MNIHSAYRIKKGMDVWSILTDIKIKGMGLVREELVTLYQGWQEDEAVMESIKTTVLDSGADSMVLTTEMKYLLCSMYAQKQYHQALEMKTRQMNLSVYIQVRKLGQRYYLIPECGGVLSKSLDFLEKDRRLEEYAYWDSTETPENISPQAWAGRRKVWLQLLDKSGGYYCKIDQYLTIDICSTHTFESVDPLMILEAA